MNSQWTVIQHDTALIGLNVIIIRWQLAPPSTFPQSQGTGREVRRNRLPLNAIGESAAQTFAVVSRPVRLASVEHSSSP